MHKVSRRTLLTLLVLASVVAATAAAAPMALPSDEARGEEIKLLRLDAKGAVVLLRSIAGVKEVEIVDDKTLRVQGTPDRVLLARKILELTEATGGTADAEGRYDVGDGTIVACAALRESSRNELMTALRELGISKHRGRQRAPDDPRPRQRSAGDSGPEADPRQRPGRTLVAAPW